MLEFKTVNLKRARVETLAVPVCEDGDLHSDQTLKSLAAAAKAKAEFKGKTGDCVTLFQPAGTKIERAVLFGVGKSEDLQAETLRAFAGKAVKFCVKAGLASVTIATPAASATKMDAAGIFKALMEGGCLGSHNFDRYKAKKKKKSLRKIVILATAAQKKAHAGLVESVEAVCSGSVMARE